jgi:hypothetical protein
MNVFLGFMCMATRVDFKRSIFDARSRGNDIISG